MDNSIPAWVVGLGALWSVLGWVWFAKAFEIRPLWALAIPFVLVAGLYGWFTLANVPVELRAQWVRVAIFVIVYCQGPALSLLAWLKGRGHV